MRNPTTLTQAEENKRDLNPPDHLRRTPRPYKRHPLAKINQERENKENRDPLDHLRRV